MRTSLPITRALVLLCLIAFQAQALARVSLTCQHEVDPAAGCPMHAGASQAQPTQAAPAGEQGEVLDCLKCTLVMVLGSLQVSPSAELCGTCRRGVDHARPAADRDYHVFPERPVRPPQSPLA